MQKNEPIYLLKIVVAVSEECLAKISSLFSIQNSKRAFSLAVGMASRCGISVGRFVLVSGCMAVYVAFYVYGIFVVRGRK